MRAVALNWVIWDVNDTIKYGSKKANVKDWVLCAQNGRKLLRIASDDYSSGRTERPEDKRGRTQCQLAGFVDDDAVQFKSMLLAEIIQLNVGPHEPSQM